MGRRRGAKAATSPRRSAAPRPGPKAATIARAAALGITVPEAVRLGQRVATALCNLGEFRLYWSARHRCIVARSVNCTRHWRVPEGAVLVGTFAAPIRAADILDDLLELVAGLPESEAVLLAPADPCELHQAKPETAPPAAIPGAGDAIAPRRKRSHAAHPWRSL